MYTIGEFAKKTGVTTRTLRFYDQKGLLKPSHLSESGRRHYTDKDLATLQNILVFKYLGYPLDEIRSMLRTAGGKHAEAKATGTDAGSAAGRDWSAMLKRQREELLKEKARIEKVLATLDYAIALADKREAIDPDIFLSVIHNLAKEDEQKAFLKSVLPEDLVDELFEASREDLLRDGGRFLGAISKIKEAYRRRLPDEEVAGIVQEMLASLPRRLLDRLAEQSERLDAVQFDEALFPIPLTKDEERWLQEVMERMRDKS